MPPASHLIFIPMVLLIGIAVGFILGGRAARDAEAARARTSEERAARRAARIEAAQKGADPTNRSGA